MSALTGLKNDSRLAIYRGLVQAGPLGMTPSCISRELGIPPSTLSFHLKELSHAQLVTAVPEGRSITYLVNHDTMASVISFLTDNCC